MSWHCRGKASEYKCCALVTTARGHIRWLSWLAGWPDNQSGTNSCINLFGPIRLLEPREDSLARSVTHSSTTDSYFAPLHPESQRRDDFSRATIAYWKE